MNFKTVNFKSLKDIKKLPLTKKLYLAPVDSNRVQIVERFLNILNNEFKTLLIDTSYKKNVKVYTHYNEDGSREKGMKDSFYISFLAEWFGGCSVTFKIDNYIYYLNVAANPMFEGYSYISSQPIKQDERRRSYVVDVLPAEHENINNCFNADVWTRRCDIETNAQQLYNFFIKNKFETPSKATSRVNPQKRYIIEEEQR